MKLLEFEGNVEEVFCLNFEVTYKSFGESLKKNLIVIIHPQPLTHPRKTVIKYLSQTKTDKNTLTFTQIGY